MTQPLDICIRGDGIVGRALALLLARERLRVGLVSKPQPPTLPTDPVPSDVRAYALNARSKTLLNSLRCWPDPHHATEVVAMQVHGDDKGEVNFSAHDLNVPGLTWIVDVAALETQLGEAVRFQPHIELLDSPQPATLTVICEGKASSTRAEFGVDFEVTPYQQIAIAARLTCSMPHRQTARQWFSQGEILAFLPIDGPLGSSVAMVWSVNAQRAPSLLDASASEFCQHVAAASQASLGNLSLVSERNTWPLQMARAKQWVGTHQGKAWAGDAAHNVHPLAGQGLNLGLADVGILAEILGKRDYWRSVDDIRLLRRYERSRKAEVIYMGAAMDGLQQLFSQSSAPVQTLRNWGMNGFEHSGVIKQWVARQAMGF
jgi:2-polyprenyl-6-methoxyphenol hydroxylase-like FAD-dependent oxidoreductase